jgi:hypothetical protein
VSIPAKARPQNNNNNKNNKNKRNNDNRKITIGIGMAIGLTKTICSHCCATTTPVIQVAYLQGKTRQTDRYGQAVKVFFAHAIV